MGVWVSACACVCVYECASMPRWDRVYTIFTFIVVVVVVVVVSGLLLYQIDLPSMHFHVSRTSPSIHTSEKKLEIGPNGKNRSGTEFPCVALCGEQKTTATHLNKSSFCPFSWLRALHFDATGAKITFLRPIKFQMRCTPNDGTFSECEWAKKDGNFHYYRAVNYAFCPCPRCGLMEMCNLIASSSYRDRIASKNLLGFSIVDFRSACIQYAVLSSTCIVCSVS